MTGLETLTMGTNSLGSLDLCPLTSGLSHLTTLNISNTNLTRYRPIRGWYSSHVTSIDQSEA